LHAWLLGETHGQAARQQRVLLDGDDPPTPPCQRRGQFTMASAEIEHDVVRRDGGQVK